MMPGSGSAILVVSYGTSDAKAAARSLERIEEEIAQAFPKRRLYRAWTSRTAIERRLEKGDGQIDSVPAALSRMVRDGITDLIVQPTHVIEGAEYQKLVSALISARTGFETVRLGRPLLSSQQDIERMALVMTEIFGIPKEREGVVLVGHGTNGAVNAVYHSLSEVLRTQTDGRMMLGLVEERSGIDTVIGNLKEAGAKRVKLAPFLLTAGVHASRDLLGSRPDSWMSRLCSAGFDVAAVPAGLGEYAQVRTVFTAHAREAKELF